MAVVSVDLVETYLLNTLEQLRDYGGSEEAKPIKPQLAPSVQAQAIYQKLTASQFCRRRPAQPERFVEVIEQAIQSQQPIPCILGHGPLKNQNNCPYSHADWAELFAYRQLMKLAKAVKQMYAPGLQVTLYVDDARSEYANHIDPALTQNYSESLREVIVETGLNQLIREVVSFKTLYPKFEHQKFLVQAEADMREWAADPKNEPQMVMYVEHALRNIPDSMDLSSHERQILAWDSAIRYLACYEAEKRCGIWNQPGYLYMRYSPHEGHYQIFTLRKGSVSQPWQGQGALLLTSAGKLDPCIYTRYRQSTYSVIDNVETPLNYPGFQQIKLVTQQPAPVLVGC